MRGHDVDDVELPSRMRIRLSELLVSIPNVKIIRRSDSFAAILDGLRSWKASIQSGQMGRIVESIVVK
jgi:hypothetical protein